MGPAATCTRPSRSYARHAEFIVDGSLVGWVSVGERADDVLELSHEGFDFVLRMLSRGRLTISVVFDVPAFSFNLGNPGRGTRDLAVHEPPWEMDAR